MALRPRLSPGVPLSRGSVARSYSVAQGLSSEVSVTLKVACPIQGRWKAVGGQWSDGQPLRRLGDRRSRDGLGSLLGLVFVGRRGRRGRKGYPIHISGSVLCIGKYPYNTSASLISVRSVVQLYPGPSP